MSGILDRLHSSGVSPHQLNQLTINCYDPGDGIPSHFDTHSPFEEVFVSLSLLGNIVMEFQSYAQ
jgi:alkylated DNA repair protein alkB family protein 8